MLVHAGGAPQRIQYFGYYRDDGKLSEIQDHANLTIGLEGSDESGSPAVKVLKDAKNRKLKVMLFLQGIGIGFREEKEWKEKWERYAANVKPYVSPKTVAAFYMYDEPPLEITPEYRARLELGAKVVRETFPGIPIALGYGWWHLAPKNQKEWPLTPPAGYDWFGFNCYGPVNDCMDGSSVADLVKVLKSKLKPGQRIMLIPEGTDFWHKSYEKPFDEDELVTRADEYMALAKSEPAVVAVVPFVWSDAQFERTVSNLPKLKAKFRKIGKSITGK